MYAFIRGTVASAVDGEVVLDNHGIGYLLVCPASTVAACTVGDEVTLLTYLAVREDAMVLYGFIDEASKKLFLQLIEVGGIGPRSACQILSGVTPYDLALAIAAGDTKALSGIKGIGKKTAERIIVELKEKVGAEVPAADASVSRAVSDAIVALETLGFTRSEAAAAVHDIEGAAGMTTETIVTAVFRGMKR